jgi:hypothetical protein
MHEDDRERACRQGAQAWKRLKGDSSWNDWLKVGLALQIGREWAMHQAGVSAPQGKGYNLAFGEWLVTHKFNDMDKSERARLFEVMDNLGPIEAWRATLPLNQRLKFNHPNTVLRRWKAAIEPESDTEMDPSKKKPTLRDHVVRLAVKNRRIAELEAHVTELEAAREQPLWECEPEAIARAIAANMGLDKVREVVAQLLDIVGHPEPVARPKARKREKPDDRAERALGTSG